MLSEGLIARLAGCNDKLVNEPGLFLTRRVSEGFYVGPSLTRRVAKNSLLSSLVNRNVDLQL